MSILSQSELNNLWLAYVCYCFCTKIEIQHAYRFFPISFVRWYCCCCCRLFPSEFASHSPITADQNEWVFISVFAFIRIGHFSSFFFHKWSMHLSYPFCPYIAVSVCPFHKSCPFERVPHSSSCFTLSLCAFFFSLL